MEQKFNLDIVESEDLLKAYEKIHSFIKFLDSEKDKIVVEGKDG